MSQKWPNYEHRGLNVGEYRKATLKTHNALPLSCILHFPPCLTGAVAWLGRGTPAATRNTL